MISSGSECIYIVRTRASGVLGHRRPTPWDVGVRTPGTWASGGAWSFWVAQCVGKLMPWLAPANDVASGLQPIQGITDTA